MYIMHIQWELTVNKSLTKYKKLNRQYNKNLPWIQRSDNSQAIDRECSIALYLTPTKYLVLVLAHLACYLHNEAANSALRSTYDSTQNKQVHYHYTSLQIVQRKLWYPI